MWGVVGWWWAVDEVVGLDGEILVGVAYHSAVLLLEVGVQGVFLGRVRLG